MNFHSIQILQFSWLRIIQLTAHFFGVVEIYLLLRGSSWISFMGLFVLVSEIWVLSFSSIDSLLLITLIKLFGRVVVSVNTATCTICLHETIFSFTAAPVLNLTSAVDGKRWPQWIIGEKSFVKHILIVFLAISYNRLRHPIKQMASS